MHNCYECGTQYEIILEIAWGGRIENGIPVWYCPQCKAGCGELTNFEITRFQKGDLRNE